MRDVISMSIMLAPFVPSKTQNESRRQPNSVSALQIT